jgi:D-beta-D-heptose 7-phosphate kinase/D-beta-D-heptose 1-phosphate adenosyltransferase
LSAVDFVTFFGEDTPENLIHLLRPDVLVKGGDWPIEKIVGASFVMSYGGEVRTLQFVEGRSTTRLVEKMKT